MNEIEWYDGLKGGGNSVVVTDIQSTHARLLLEPETEELADVMATGSSRAETIE